MFFKINGEEGGRAPPHNSDALRCTFLSRVLIATGSGASQICQKGCH